MYKKLFTKATLLLTIAGLAINILLVWFMDISGIPLYLDSIGTVIAAALGGILPGIAVGFFSNLITAVMAVTPDPMTMYYAFLNVLIAVAAAGLSAKGFLRKWTGLLTATAIFVAIGGGLGSVVTWVLYGFSFGQGITAPFAVFLYNTFHMSEFAAQFSADMIIDVIDKTVTVAALLAVLRLLPDSVLNKLPLGVIYSRKARQSTSNVAEKTVDLIHGQRLFRRRSIRTKITYLILGSATFLSIIALLISCVTYKNKLIEQYSEMCSDTVAMMLPKVDGDLIDTYLEQGDSARGYTETENNLYEILNNAEKIKFMYVYSIRPDGCHVVFDLDTDKLEGEKAGTVVEFDKSFPYINETIAGMEIAPVITNDTYGWLLTVYEPVKDSSGTVTAYAAADIDMQQIKTELYSFCISITSLLFGVLVIITAFSLWYCDRKLLDPISILVEQARGFNLNGQSSGGHVRDRLSVKTGDEIEEVFNTMCLTEDAIETHIAKLKEKNLEISYMQRNIIYTLANMVENRDNNTGEHIRHTADYVKLIGQKLYDAGLYSDTVDNEYINKLYDSAPLHDIGKIKISDAILNKPGRLTPEEFELMKTHTTEGANILCSSLSDIEDGSWLSMAIDLSRHHHERWDGKGYPDGLSGPDIPLCARIMAVSDVFDALVSVRSYKKAFSYEESIKIIRDGAGTQFDARIVEIFAQSEKEIRAIMDSH